MAELIPNKIVTPWFDIEIHYRRDKSVIYWEVQVNTSWGSFKCIKRDLDPMLTSRMIDLIGQNCRDIADMMRIKENELKGKHDIKELIQRLKAVMGAYEADA